MRRRIRWFIFLGGLTRLVVTVRRGEGSERKELTVKPEELSQRIWRYRRDPPPRPSLLLLVLVLRPRPPFRVIRAIFHRLLSPFILTLPCMVAASSIRFRRSLTLPRMVAISSIRFGRSLTLPLYGGH
jgi:hypothetical protein